MDNTRGTQGPDESTNHEQNQGANNVPIQIVTIDTSSGTNVGDAGSGSGSDAGAGGGNGAIRVVRTYGDGFPVDLAIGEDGLPVAFAVEPFQSPFGAIFINVEPNEDILEVLSSIAQEKEVFILMAIGHLSCIELCNRKDAPVVNTVLQGLFAINSLDGNMVIPKENEPYRASRIDVLVNAEDGKLRGGPVRKLITKSRVQVMVSTMSTSGIANWARNAQFKRDYIDKIYEETLNELNERNTFAWRYSPLNE